MKTITLLLLLWSNAHGDTKVVVDDPIVVPVAYRNVGRLHGIPYKYLFAIAMQESQRSLADGRVMPWPWTLNVAGDGRFYETGDDLWRDLVGLVEQGVTNVDIGLMQINLKWHHHRIDSLRTLVRPEHNINIAAAILVQEYERCDGDWWCAVGGYHSYRQSVAADYVRRVRRWYERLI